GQTGVPEDVGFEEYRRVRVDGADGRGRLVVERRQLLAVEERAAEYGGQERRCAWRRLVHDLEAANAGRAIEVVRDMFEHQGVTVLQPDPVRCISIGPERIPSMLLGGVEEDIER